jgi:PAS domain S-box-containing protein
VFAEEAEDFFERAPCGYLTTRFDGTIARVNGTFLAWTGYEREDLVGRRFVQLLTAGGRIYHETHYAPLLTMQGSVREMAFDVKCADDSLLPVLVNASLELDSEGAPLLIRAVLFDASHRRAYERELLRVRDEERRAREREQAARESLERLQRMSRALVASLDPALIGATALDAAASLATSGQGFMLRVDEAMRTVEAEAWIGEAPTRGSTSLDAEEFAPLRTAMAHGVQGAPKLGSPQTILGVEAAGWGEGAVIQICAAEGRVVGAFWLGRSSDVALNQADAGFLAAVSEQSALALERARLFEHEHDVARTLQQSLLADTYPLDPRIEIAACYQAGVSDLSVGGDWHDSFMPTPDRLLLIVGDIVGRGLQAASTMGRLRSAVRSLAVAGFRPAALLSSLDAFVELDEAARLATLICVDVDLESGRALMASAGHLPALLLANDASARYVWEGRSLPLGTLSGPPQRKETTVELPPGTRLILYTDGLVERRKQPIDAGLDMLLKEASRSRQLPLGEMIGDTVRSLLADERLKDDVCLLVADFT